MLRIVERWLLFKYVGREFTPLSKPLKKNEHAEEARLKYLERERKTIWGRRDPNELLSSKIEEPK
jgi:hypothetical protein